MINSKRKGKEGELELTAMLRCWGYDARRGQQFKGSPDSPDVISTIDGIHIEAKRVEKLNLYEAYEQAKKDAGKDEVPTVWHRKNRSEWMITMRAEDFLKILQRAIVEECERKAFWAGWAGCHEGILGIGSIDCREAYKAYKEKQK